MSLPTSAKGAPLRGRPNGTASRAETPAEILESKRGGLAFALLMTFTLMLYARPGDLYRPLSSMRLAELSAMAAVAAYAMSFVFGKPRFYRSRELVLMVALTLLFVAGIPSAFWRSGALKVLTDTWIKTALIFFLLTQTTTTMPRIRKLLWSIIICMFVVSLYTALNPMYSQGRLIGATVGFLSGNYLGVAASSMMPMMALFFMKTRSWILKLVLAATVLLLFWQVILTASRSNLILVSASVLLIWFLLLRRMKGAHLLAAVASVALIIFLATAPAVFWNRLQTLWTGDVEQNWQAQSAKFSEQQRENIFWRSIEYTLEDPLLGVGLGNFSIKSGNVTGRASEWLGTHNTYTQISSEAGIPALLIYLGLSIGSIRGMMRLSRKTRGKPEFEEFYLLARATLIGLIVFAIAGFFAHLAYDYYFYYIVGFGACLKGAFARASEGTPPSTENGRTGLRPGWAR